MSIGLKIRELRIKRKLTQDQLGEMIGVTGSAVSSMEKSNAKVPHADTLPLYAAALGVDVSYFTDDEPTEEQSIVQNSLDFLKGQITELNDRLKRADAEKATLLDILKNMSEKLNGSPNFPEGNEPLGRVMPMYPELVAPKAS